MKLHSNSTKKLSKYHFIYRTFSGKKVGGGDILCEMRFHVLNNELESWAEKKEKENEEKKAEENKDAESDGEDDEMTAAKLFN